MSFDDELRRAIDTLTDRIRDEVAREVAAARESVHSGEKAAGERLVSAFRALDQATSLTEILDTLAAMVSGSQLRPGRSAIGYVSALGGVPEASIVGTPVRTSAVNAALANGMLYARDTKKLVCWNLKKSP